MTRSNAAAKQADVPIDAITSKFAAVFHDDMAALGVPLPTIEPRATEHISQMIAMIESLIEKGHAYEADGHVLFHVPSFAEYGTVVSAGSREDYRRRQGRGCAVQTRCRRFCALEALDDGSAGLGQSVGPRPPGLALGMRVHDRGASGRYHRHSRRWQRSGFPSSRERNCSGHLRPRWPDLQPLLDARGLRQRGQGKDVQVARQCIVDQGFAQGGAGRSNTAGIVECPLPQPGGLEHRHTGPGSPHSGSFIRRAS